MAKRQSPGYKFRIRELLRINASQKSKNSKLSKKQLYTQEQIALCNQLNTSVQYLSRMCAIKRNQNRGISSNKLEKIANYFQVPIQSLFTSDSD